MALEDDLKHLVKMINKRGYLVVSEPKDGVSLEAGDRLPQVFVMDKPTGTPAYVICETDYKDMNAQWPDRPDIFTAAEAVRYRFYRVSLD